ncbi:Phosphatidylglycerophosphatase GEP4 [Yarrowia sp. C11]|nr:Phosphatidylglycerophosphatase GEP4 [Yarrowia sp. E02]KAG5369663.1 Phosphatidylglycerophosphatase GEP4 [Yarrowia sp. C11]
MVNGLNLSATLNTFKLLFNPSLIKPHVTVSNFSQLPVPIPGQNGAQIKAVILDKDNCFAVDGADHVFEKYNDKMAELKKQYPNKLQLLIVSNSAGTNDDTDFKDAIRVEQNTGIEVYRHAVKKPGCHEDIVEYLKKNNVIDKPSEVAVVGDRLLTDVVMANQIGGTGVWLSEGVEKSNKLPVRFERMLYNFMQ